MPTAGIRKAGFALCSKVAMMDMFAGGCCPVAATHMGSASSVVAWANATSKTGPTMDRASHHLGQSLQILR